MCYAKTKQIKLTKRSGKADRQTSAKVLSIQVEIIACRFTSITIVDFHIISATVQLLLKNPITTPITTLQPSNGVHLSFSPADNGGKNNPSCLCIDY